MVFDYNALKTWKTPDLLSRDRILVNKTRVMGMSEKAAIIHVVALVCTAGFSLPINLGFCTWHAHRYGEVKKERTWIRQILVTRNMSYRGKGQWVEVQPTPANTRPKVQPGGTPNLSREQRVQQVQTVRPNPNRGQREQVQSNPNRMQKVQVQPNPNRMHKVQGQPNPNRRRQRPPPANNDPPMQYAQANANSNASVNNDLQMQFEGADAYSYASVNDSQQDFGNNADYNYDLQMQYMETNAYVSVDDFDQEYGNYADNDPQMQVEQDVGDSAMNDLEQDFGTSDALTEAIVPGLLELLAS